MLRICEVPLKSIRSIQYDCGSMSGVQMRENKMKKCCGLQVVDYLCGVKKQMLRRVSDCLTKL